MPLNKETNQPIYLLMEGELLASYLHLWFFIYPPMDFIVSLLFFYMALALK